MIGVIAGSFDPITNGHLWLIKKSALLVGTDGKLYVIVGVNKKKSYYFSVEERISQITQVLEENLSATLFKRIIVESITNDLLINRATDLGATHIFRGVRNSKDFEYETDIQRVNRKINPRIETVFFVPPDQYVEVSSSTIKDIVGFNGWEEAVRDYIDIIVLNDFKKRLYNLIKV